MHGQLRVFVPVDHESKGMLKSKERESPLRHPHTAQTQTNDQLPLSDHYVAFRLTRLAEKLHSNILP